MLADVPLFHGLSEAQLGRLEEAMMRRVLSPGTEMITAQQPGELAYVILDGSVKVHVEHEDGSSVVLAVLGSGEVVGEMSLADSLGRSATVVTLEETTVLWMSRAAFWDVLKEMPKITYNLVGILSRRLRLANVHAQTLSRLDVHGRVAAQLLAFAREYGEEAEDGSVLIPLRLTQGDLAGLVGASRVRVNQAIGSYRRRKYLSLNRGGRVVLHDPAALARRCR